ncbi:MAG: ExbD/TolR family protein [Candidatus Omnitrophota bacterium]
MKVKTSRKSFLSLESVAMTDIVMNLFIFFFISFSLLYTFNPKRESKIEVKLPRGQASAEAKADSPLEVSVTSGNEIFIGKTRVPPQKLKQELVSRAKLSKPSGLLVRADKSASVDTLVQVLDSAKQAGLEKLGVAIERQ